MEETVKASVEITGPAGPAGPAGPTELTEPTVAHPPKAEKLRFPVLSSAASLAASPWSLASLRVWCSSTDVHGSALHSPLRTRPTLSKCGSRRDQPPAASKTPSHRTSQRFPVRRWPSHSRIRLRLSPRRRKSGCPLLLLSLDPGRARHSSQPTPCRHLSLRDLVERHLPSAVGGHSFQIDLSQ